VRSQPPVQQNTIMTDRPSQQWTVCRFGARAMARFALQSSYAIMVTARRSAERLTLLDLFAIPVAPLSRKDIPPGR